MSGHLGLCEPAPRMTFLISLQVFNVCIFVRCDKIHYYALKPQQRKERRIRLDRLRFIVKDVSEVRIGM